MHRAFLSIGKTAGSHRGHKLASVCFVPHFSLVVVWFCTNPITRIRAQLLLARFLFLSLSLSLSRYSLYCIPSFGNPSRQREVWVTRPWLQDNRLQSTHEEKAHDVISTTPQYTQLAWHAKLLNDDLHAQTNLIDWTRQVDWLDSRPQKKYPQAVESRAQSSAHGTLFAGNHVNLLYYYIHTHTHPTLLLVSPSGSTTSTRTLLLRVFFPSSAFLRHIRDGI